MSSATIFKNLELMFPDYRFQIFRHSMTSFHELNGLLNETLAALRDFLLLNFSNSLNSSTCLRTRRHQIFSTLRQNCKGLVLATMLQIFIKYGKKHTLETSCFWNIYAKFGT